MSTIQIITLVLVALIFLVVVLIFVGIRLLPRMIRGIIREEINVMKTQIAETLALVRAQESVIAGVVAFIQSHTAAVDAALDAEDLDALREANEGLKANTGALAQAIAVGTPASDEVPAELGGTGDDGDNVDPETVELEAPAEAPATAGEDAGAGKAGEDAEQQ